MFVGPKYGFLVPCACHLFIVFSLYFKQRVIMEHLFFVTNLLINLPILMWDQGLSFALKVVQNVSFPGNFAYALNGLF